jgi:four helix bundle protein
MEYSFERLDAWKQLRQLVKSIYRVTQEFPHSELFGLTNQLRRASVSAASNLVEGSARFSKKDQAHFYNTSYSSLIEILAQLLISQDLGYIDENCITEIRLQIEVCTRLLNALRKSVCESV